MDQARPFTDDLINVLAVPKRELMLGDLPQPGKAMPAQFSTLTCTAAAHLPLQCDQAGYRELSALGSRLANVDVTAKLGEDGDQTVAVSDQSCPHIFEAEGTKIALQAFLNSDR